MEVEGKVAVITGGASGIGLGIAKALLEKRATVVLADVEESKAAAVAAALGKGGASVVAIGCDVSSEQQVEELAGRAWSECGRVDLLFNNAGVGGGGPLLDACSDDLHWLFSVNLFGVWYGCKAFGRRFREQGSRSWIVNTGSEHSLGVPHLFEGIYTATKHAVLGLSDVLRRELPPNIGISVLCPGIVASDFWASGKHRPANYGGPREGLDFSRSVMARGMDPLDIGRRAVAGVENEEFFIMTHPHAAPSPSNATGRSWQRSTHRFRPDRTTSATM